LGGKWLHETNAKEKEQKTCFLHVYIIFLVSDAISIRVCVLHRAVFLKNSAGNMHQSGNRTSMHRGACVEESQLIIHVVIAIRNERATVLFCCV
jgi:hypothetical protein